MAPGWMEGLPPKDVVRSLYENDGQQLILGSCFSGGDKDGASNAQQLADIVQLPRENVYGCTGFIGMWSQSTNCDGHWVNGNGEQLTDEKRQSLALRNCTFPSVDPNTGRTSVKITQEYLHANCN